MQNRLCGDGGDLLPFKTRLTCRSNFSGPSQLVWKWHKNLPCHYRKMAVCRSSIASSSRKTSISCVAPRPPCTQRHLRSVYRKQLLSKHLRPDLEGRFLSLSWRKPFNKSSWLTLNLRTSYLSLLSTKIPSLRHHTDKVKQGWGFNLFSTGIKHTCGS